MTTELNEAGRAIAPELRRAWLVALRADLRRAVRNILRTVGGDRCGCVDKKAWVYEDKLFRLELEI